MKINDKIFREYDIRGIADLDLGNDVVYSIARAYASYLNLEGRKVAVGMDNRLSGPRIKKAFIKGLVDSGCKVIDVGIVPTPVLYYSIFLFKASAGVNITASHNPKEYNGFKLCAESAKPLYGSDIEEIGKLAKKQCFAKPKKKGSSKKRDAIKHYTKMVLSKVKLKRNLRVVLDCGNGTASSLAPLLLRKAGCKVKCLYCKSDGNFPNHIADPTKPEAMKDLAKEVKKGNYDFGIGLDGDADRIGIVDEKGKLVFGEYLLLLFAKDLFSRKKGSEVIFDVKCSKAVPEAIAAMGGIPFEWKTGHSLIKTKMKERNALLAGEMSGHMFFGENYFMFDDALYASCKLAEIISREHKPVSLLIGEFPHYFSSPEIRLDCPDEKKFEVVEKLKILFSEKYKVSTIDGIKVYFDDGWALLRASNTQPKIILRIESISKAGYEQIKRTVFSFLKLFPEVKLKDS